MAVTSAHCARIERTTLASWRSVASVAAVVASLALAACGTPHGPSVPWTAAPADGTWEWGDVSFGQPTPIRTMPIGAPEAYSFTITAPPTLTTFDEGKSVTISSPVSVHRVNEGRDDVIDEKFFIYEPGVIPANVVDMNEAYGTNPDVQCQNNFPPVGETTTCTVSFTAKPNEIPNSFWQINDYRVGTWPSQVAHHQ
jgi:hypothetical protein